MFSIQVGKNLKRMLASLLAHSEQAIINLHILTDEETKPWVEATISNVVGRHITEGVVFGYEDNNVTLRTKFLGDIIYQEIFCFFFIQMLMFSQALFQMTPCRP